MAARPKYNSAYHDPWAWSLAVKGATDVEIADAFGVSEKAVNNWKYKKGADGKPLIDEEGNKVLTSFGEALQCGKDAADASVEHSMYKRATGYEVTEEEKILEYGTDGSVKPIRIRSTKKHIPPDTMAGMYWLNNRKRKTGEWSQRQDISISMSNEVDLSNLTEDELRRLAALSPPDKE